MDPYQIETLNPLPTERRTIPVDLLAPARTTTKVPTWAWIVGLGLLLYFVTE